MGQRVAGHDPDPKSSRMDSAHRPLLLWHLLRQCWGMPGAPSAARDGPWGGGTAAWGCDRPPLLLCHWCLISLYLVAVQIKSVLVAASHFPLHDSFVLLVAAGRS